MFGSASVSVHISVSLQAKEGIQFSVYLQSNFDRVKRDESDISENCTARHRTPLAYCSHKYYMCKPHHATSNIMMFMGKDEILIRKAKSMWNRILKKRQISVVPGCTQHEKPEVSGCIKASVS